MDAAERARAEQEENRIVREYAAAVARGDYDHMTGEHFSSAEELLTALQRDVDAYRAAHPDSDTE